MMRLLNECELSQYPMMFGRATAYDEAAKADLATAIGYLEHFLTENKYAAGDHLTIADICLMASASTFEVTQKSKSTWTRSPV